MGKSHYFNVTKLGFWGSLGVLLVNCGQTAPEARLGKGELPKIGIMKPNDDISATPKPNSEADLGKGQNNAEQQAEFELPLPSAIPRSVMFTDENPKGGLLGGQIRILAASDESGISAYVLYWGSSSESKVADLPAIAVLPNSGSDLLVNLEPETRVPKNATHFLVFTKNEQGESKASGSVAIVDLGLPSFPAISLGFKDLDPVGRRIAGSLSITRAADESDIEDYVIYWGSDENTMLPNVPPLGLVAKSGGNLQFAVGENTQMPSGATHFLVRTKNRNGEMKTGVAIQIVDLGVPQNAAVSLVFTDTNSAGGKLGGTVTISKASQEADITDYVLYWGSSATEKLANSPALATLKKGQALSYTFPANTVKPTMATHLLVRTKNGDGEMSTGPSLSIRDLGVPQNGAVSLTFTDTNPTGGAIKGTVNIVRAINEIDIQDYALYLGKNANEKLESTPLGVVAKSGASSLSVMVDRVRPVNATHFLVFTRNADGEMATGVSALIDDDGVPTSAPVSVSFKDTDSLAKKLAGTVTITRASVETFLTRYNLYWGSNANTKLTGSNVISSIPKTGGDLRYTFAAGTSIPTNATHLLVRTANADGEMASGASVAIVDLGVPTNAAVSLGFSDTDLQGGQVAGTVFISKSAVESDIVSYVLYWGSSSTSKLAGSEAIAKLPKTGQNLTHTIAANTALPAGATHLLVRTENADGEMASGPFLLIDDNGLPTAVAANVSFTDTNASGGKLDGTLNITKATAETSLTSYVIYWGSSASTKLSGTSALRDLPKTGNNLSFTLPLGTSIPQGATHFLVRSKNADGEMSTGPSVLIVDAGVPTFQAAGVTFADTDFLGGRLGGNVTITKATNEASITQYVLYWGSAATTKLAGSAAIATINKTGRNLTHSFVAGTVKPASATHILVFTKNASGEMATGASVAIRDVGVPTNTAGGISFTDTDLVKGKVAGSISITKAASEADLTHYEVYWGFNSTTKLPDQTKIVSLAKTGSNLTHVLLAGTVLPENATHLLVFTRNLDGEMSTPKAFEIVDK